MGSAYGQSGQGSSFTIGSVGPLKTTRMKLRKAYSNADTTVTDDGWGRLCPVYRDWMIDIEMPSRTADSSQTIVDAFDSQTFPPNVEDVDLPSCTFVLPNGRTYSGSGMLDGEVQVDNSAKDAVRLIFTVKGSGALTQS